MKWRSGRVILFSFTMTDYITAAPPGRASAKSGVQLNASNIKNIFIQLNRISYYYYRMIGEHFPKVSPPSRQSLKSYNAKFVMDMYARNKYGATLRGHV